MIIISQQSFKSLTNWFYSDIDERFKSMHQNIVTNIKHFAGKNLVAETYVKYTRKNYRLNVTTVFDGYHNKITKSHEHLR